MRSSRTVIVGSVLGVLIAGCGTKGPLYIPGVPVDARWPYPTPTPAQQIPEKKPADVPGTSDEKK